MLRLLKISNLAIIDNVEVEFCDGFNVLTGETGAGKSILLGALELILGSRASADVIRTGEKEAHVEALFELTNDTSLPADLRSEGGAAGEVLLSRRVSRTGRSRCAINGHLVTLAVLQTVGQSLVSIFGQHEQRSLLDAGEHLEILDRFGSLAELRTGTAAAYTSWTRARKELAASERELEDVVKLSEDNQAAADELARANLKEGEEDQLLRDRDLLRQASHIRERAFDAYQKLYARSGSLLAGLADVGKAMDFLSAATPALAKLRENFQEAMYRLEDVALELRGTAESLQDDPARLERIEDRLALIRRLKKKYGTDVPGLLAYLGELSGEAGELLRIRSDVKRLAKTVEQARNAYVQAAGQLSAARRKAATELESAVERELKELAMPTAVFNVNFRDSGRDGAAATGQEKAEFFLASNPGEAPRPMARVASGGELSRIMLALKALKLDEGQASTVIFDEVDAGIGGHTALAVGTRLARVADRQQVLCVTHLHQIAAMANHHYSVRKLVKGGRTRIEVRPLDNEERVEELTRMLGAGADSQSAREHVRQLMELRTAEVPA